MKRRCATAFLVVVACSSSDPPKSDPPKRLPKESPPGEWRPPPIIVAKRDKAVLESKIEQATKAGDSATVEKLQKELAAVEKRLADLEKKAAPAP